MPTVPRYDGQQLQPAGPPAAGLQTLVTPESLGGGAAQGLARAGQAAVSGAMAAHREQQREQEQANQTVVGQSQVSLLEAEQDLLWNPEQGLMFKQGRAAFEQREKVFEKFRKRASEIRDGLANDAQRDAFDQIRAREELDFRRKVERHVGTELHAEGERTVQARISALQQAAGTSAHDPDAVAARLAEQEQILGEYADNNAEHLGMDKSLWLQQQLRQARHATHTTVIQQLVAGGRPGDAADYLEANGEEMNPEQVPRLQSRIEAVAREDVFRHLNEGDGPEAVLERIESHREQGAIRQETATQLRRQVQGIYDRERRAQIDAFVKERRHAVDEELSREVQAHMAEAASTGGAATLTDRDLERPVFSEEELDRLPPEVADELRGETVSPTRDEAIERAIHDHFGMINREVSEGRMEPDEAGARKVQFLADNNVTHDVWRQVMGAGYAAARGSALAEEERPPRNTVQGYELYKMLRRHGGGLADRHLGDSQTRLFYQLAEVTERYVHQNDPVGALSRAARAMRQEPFTEDPARRVTADQAEEAAEKIIRPGGRLWRIITFGRDQQALNHVDVEQKVVQLARVLAATDPGILGGEEAAEEAARRISETHEIVNGIAVDFGNVKTMPPDLDEVTQHLAMSYAGQFGEEEAVDASELVVVPAETDDMWMLYNVAAHERVARWQQPVDEDAPDGRQHGVWTTDELAEISKELREAEEDEAAQRVSREVSRRARQRRERLASLEKQLRQAPPDSRRHEQLKRLIEEAREREPKPGQTFEERQQELRDQRRQEHMDQFIEQQMDQLGGGAR